MQSTTVIPWVEKDVLFLIDGTIDGNNKLVGKAYPFKAFPWAEKPGLTVWSAAQAYSVYCMLLNNRETVTASLQLKLQLEAYFGKPNSEWWVCTTPVKNANAPHLDSTNFSTSSIPSVSTILSTGRLTIDRSPKAPPELEIKRIHPPAAPKRRPVEPAMFRPPIIPPPPPPRPENYVQFSDMSAGDSAGSRLTRAAEEYRPNPAELRLGDPPPAPPNDEEEDETGATRKPLMTARLSQQYHTLPSFGLGSNHAYQNGYPKLIPRDGDDSED